MIVFNRVNKNHLFLHTVQVPDLVCPLCANRSRMEMSFYQLQLEAGWVRNTRHITGSAYCHQCSQDVPVVRWDNALDSFYKTEKAKIKVTTSFKTGKFGKILIWINILFFGSVILLTAGLFIYHRLSPKAKTTNEKPKTEEVQTLLQYVLEPQTGDIALVYLVDGSAEVLYQITDIDRFNKTIKAKPSIQTFTAGAQITKETALAVTGFDASKEKVFAVANYENRMLTTPSGERTGNISAVFRK